MNVYDLLKARHDDIQSYRVEHGYNPPGYGGGFWRCPPDYKARPYSPLWTSANRDTVVGYASAWTWGQSHHQGDWADPVEMIETTFLAHEASIFSATETDMEGTTVHSFGGNFATYSAAFQVHTTDEDLVRRVRCAAGRSLPYMVCYEARRGVDPAYHRDYRATVDEAYRWVRQLREGYKVDDAIVYRQVAEAPAA